jgi:hypothetical protein
MDIDSTFLDELEEEEKTFFKFYLKNVNFINIFFIYVNSNNEIIFLKTEKFNNLHDGTIYDKQIIELIKKNSKLYNNEYDFKNLCSYNFCINPKEIMDFLQNKIKNDYFKSYSLVQTIKYKDTIELFETMNDLYLIFKEHIENRKNNVTKKVYLKHSNKKTRKTL